MKTRKTYSNNTLIIGDRNKLNIVYHVKGGNLRPDEWRIDIYAEEKLLLKIIRWVEKEANISVLTLNYSEPVFENVSYEEVLHPEMLEPPKLTNIILTTCYAQICEIVNKLDKLNHA